MSILFATVTALAFLRLAWTDMRRFEVDPPAAILAGGGLVALRLSLGADLVFPVSTAAVLALFITATAWRRPGKIGFGDAAIIPLVALAAPRTELAEIFALYGVATVGIALLYLKARGKPLSRLRRSTSPAGPAAAIAALTGMGDLMDPSATTLIASLILAAGAVLFLFTLAGGIADGSRFHAHR